MYQIDPTTMVPPMLLGDGAGPIQSPAEAFASPIAPDGPSPFGGLIGAVGSGVTSVATGVRDWLRPPADSVDPSRTGYSADDLALARQAMLMQMGMPLLIAGMGGQTVQQRAETLGQIALAPQAANQVLTGGATRMNAATNRRELPLREADLNMRREENRLQNVYRQDRLGLDQRRVGLEERKINDEREARRAASEAFGVITGGGSPSAPLSSPNAPSAASPDAYVNAVVGVESGGRVDARPTFADGRPRSSAVGQGQFIDGTWMQFAQANPESFQRADGTPMSREEILARRTDPTLNQRAIRWYGETNGAALRGAGVEDTPQNRFLAHSFGSGGAKALLRADPNASAEAVLGPRAIEANPELRGMSAQQAVEQRLRAFNSRFGREQGNVQVASSGRVASDAAPSVGAPPPATGVASPPEMPPAQRQFFQSLPREVQQGLRAMAAVNPTGAIQELVRIGSQQPNTAGNAETGIFALNRDGSRGPMIVPPVPRQQSVPGVGLVQTSPGGTPEVVVPVPRGSAMSAAETRAEAQRQGVAYFAGMIGTRNADGTVALTEGPQDPESRRRSAQDEVLFRGMAENDQRVVRGLDDSAVKARLLQEQIGFQRGLLAGGMNSGPITQFTLPIRQVAAELGLRFGEGVGEQEMFRSVATQMAMNFRQAGDMSTQEFERYIQTATSLGNSREGNIFLAAMFTTQSERAVQRADLAREYLRTNRTMEGFDAFARERLGPVVPLATSVTQADVGRVVEVPRSIIDQMPSAARRPFNNGLVVLTPERLAVINAFNRPANSGETR